jgi:hypothetical protein
MGDFKAELTRLRALTPELNAATDRATKLVLAVEQFLNDECQLGIPAYVELNTWQEDGASVRSGNRLEYSKWEGKFRLVVSDFEEDPNNGQMYVSDRLPWVNATRDRKLATIDGIPTLLSAIAKRVESTIRDANNSAGAVEAYLGDLGVIAKEGKR